LDLRREKFEENGRNYEISNIAVFEIKKKYGKNGENCVMKNIF
jgi:hypothetical protein